MGTCVLRTSAWIPHPMGTGLSRVQVQLETVPPGTSVPRTGFPCQDLPPLGKKFPRSVSNVRLELVPTGTGVPRTVRVPV